MIWILGLALASALCWLARGRPYEDRPASHAVHHVTGAGPSCECDR